MLILFFLENLLGFKDLFKSMILSKMYYMKKIKKLQKFLFIRLKLIYRSL